MGKPRNCKCCDFNVPSGFVCIHCDDSGDPVCTESLTEAQCSGVSGIYRLGSCDITSSFCGKCDTSFVSSQCDLFFLKKNGPVEGNFSVLASGSYFPEKPLDLERISTSTSHFKRGHHLRDYKGTGTHGWLSGIVPVGATSTQGVNARLEFVNNQFPYIQNDSLVDIDYIGLCDKRQDPKYGCATIKFKNTLIDDVTSKINKFHLKMGTFLRYGDFATLFSRLTANDSGVSPKYVGPFTSTSEHISKFKSICKDPSDPRINSYLQGIVGNNNSFLQTALDDRAADCYGDLPLACCSKHTKSMSAIYEFDISEFPIDTCFTLYNVAQIKTSSSSYGYFELTGETYVKPTDLFGNGSFFEYSVPVDNYCESSDTFFSDNLPGCRFGAPGFDCDPPPPPPPPVTTTTTQDPCPPDSPSVIHCRYDYIESNSADEPPGYKKWRRKGFPSDSNCECDCPSTAQISNEWNSANGGEPQIGQCADAYVPCCKPNPPSSCFDYTVTFNPECGTTTTTTEGPTTTTTTEPPDCSPTAPFDSRCPYAVFHCEDDGPCPDCPAITKQTEKCADFPNYNAAMRHWNDIRYGNPPNANVFLVKGTCVENPAIDLCFESCQDSNDLTLPGNPSLCNCPDLEEKKFKCQYVQKVPFDDKFTLVSTAGRDDACTCACPSVYKVAYEYKKANPDVLGGAPHQTCAEVTIPCCRPNCEEAEYKFFHPYTATNGWFTQEECPFCLKDVASSFSHPLDRPDQVCPTTTTTGPPTTTTTQGPTTTSTQGPTTTSTQGPTTTSTQGPTTTTTTSVPLGCCRDCASDCDGNGIFYNDVTEAFCDGIGGTFSSDCFISQLLAPCCFTSACDGHSCRDDPDDPDSPDTPTGL